MLKSYKECVKASSVIRTNKLFSVMSELPLLGKLFKNNEQPPTAGMKKRVVTEIIYFLWEIIKIYCYVLLFIHMPMKLFSKYMATGGAGFGLENSYVYFTLIMTCLSGSIIHSRLFDVNEDSYAMLKILRIQPKVYFRIRMISRMATECIAFWSIFVILGLGPGKAMFMVLIITFSRMFGECFNILVFRMVKKRLTDIKSASVIIMLSALIVAYFVPYVRGYVPSAYDMIFNPVTLFVIFAIGAVMAYYVWNNDSYNRIVARLYVRREIDLVEEQDDSMCDTITGDEKTVAPEEHPYTGYQYMVNLFFNRNRNLFSGINMLKVVIIGVVFVVAMLAANFGYAETVKRVIMYSMPFMVFVVYCLCDVSKICHIMFYQHDRYILRNSISNSDRTEDYLYRLYRLLRINAVPVGMLVLVYIITGILILDGDSLNVIIQLCIAIISLGVLFTALGLALYYLLQPYNNEAEHTNYAYIIVTLLLYLAGYGCVYIRISAMAYMTGIVVATGLIVAGAVTLVYKVSVRTFKIRK